MRILTRGKTAFDRQGDGVGCLSSGVEPDFVVSDSLGAVGSSSGERAVFSARAPIKYRPWAPVPIPADLN